MTSDQPPTDEQDGDASGLLIEALSREDGKNSTVRVYPDRIEWIKQVSISSVGRPASDPPLIPMQSVLAVKAKRDGPLFSKVLLRTATGQVVFRMPHEQAFQVRDAIETALADPPRA